MSKNRSRVVISVKSTVPQKRMQHESKTRIIVRSGLVQSKSKPSLDFDPFGSNTHLDSRMSLIAPEQDTKGRRRHMRLSSIQTGSICSIESRSSIKEDHLFGLALGV
jgi:hypothetical protein